MTNLIPDPNKITTQLRQMDGIQVCAVRLDDELVVQANENTRAWWEAMCRQACRMLDTTAEPGLRIVVERKHNPLTLVARRIENVLVIVALPTGHPVSKSVQRAIRRAVRGSLRATKAAVTPPSTWVPPGASEPEPRVLGAEGGHGG